MNDCRRFCLPKAVAKSSAPSEVEEPNPSTSSGFSILQPPPVGRIGTESGLSTQQKSPKRGFLHMVYSSRCGISRKQNPSLGGPHFFFFFSLLFSSFPCRG